MLDPADVRPAPAPPRARLLRSDPPDPLLSARCYREVGADWAWVDRLAWSDNDWTGWVAVPGHELWTAYEGDDLAGYFELHPDDDRPGSTELAFFGLLPGFSGRGLGGWLLTRALERAWVSPATRRVWVHTCDLDSPGALPNYRARGLREYTAWTEHRLMGGEQPPPRPSR
jgi:GNAT superfamily N-acetyltransferase